MQLHDYFTDEQIIWSLCKTRIKRAERRRERQYVRRLEGGQADLLREDELDSLLPPRRRWSHFRPITRHPGTVADPNLMSLVRAAQVLRTIHPNPPWAINLDHFIATVRQRVFGNESFAFEAPEIHWKLKKQHEYRALCRFTLADNVINKLVTKYFRDSLEPVFEPTSYAFRARNSDGIMPTHHHAFEAIYNLKHSAPSRDLYVAECDIRGFYDSVDHSVVIESLERAAANLRKLKQQELDAHAVRVLQAYLACYSFPQNVLAGATANLRQEDPQGYFPWPAGADGLGQYHADPHSQRIGVPQGGALSCVIANLVLDYADKKVAEAQGRHRVHYFRYCDDMILLARRSKDCQRVFSTYLTTLKDLKLPYHLPATVDSYGPGFWTEKSKAPYRWTGRKFSGCVPWVQFVGYQVRYDGLVRIKKESFFKHLAKLRETVDKVKFRLLTIGNMNLGPFRSPPVKASRGQALSSLRQKLICMAVGRVNPLRPSSGPMPLCWANGYRALHGKPIVPMFLKQFDRERERQIRRFGRADIAYGAGIKVRNHGGRNARNAKGYAVSYTAQFQNAGGLQLIQHPYRPWSFKRLVTEPVCRFGSAFEGYRERFLAILNSKINLARRWVEKFFTVV